MLGKISSQVPDSLPLEQLASSASTSARQVVKRSSNVEYSGVCLVFNVFFYTYFCKAWTFWMNMIQTDC